MAVRVSRARQRKMDTGSGSSFPILALSKEWWLDVSEQGVGKSRLDPILQHPPPPPPPHFAPTWLPWRCQGAHMPPLLLPKTRPPQILWLSVTVVYIFSADVC